MLQDLELIELECLEKGGLICYPTDETIKLTRNILAKVFAVSIPHNNLKKTRKGKIQLDQITDYEKLHLDELDRVDVLFEIEKISGVSTAQITETLQSHDIQLSFMQIASLLQLALRNINVVNDAA